MELTDREIQVLTYIAEGLSNEEIAKKMILSIHTVKAHICSIFAKLQANGRVQAAVKALKMGII